MAPVTERRAGSDHQVLHAPGTLHGHLQVPSRACLGGRGGHVALTRTLCSPSAAPSLARHCWLQEARWTWKCGPGLAVPSSLQEDTLPGRPASIRDLTVAEFPAGPRPRLSGADGSLPGPELRPLPGRWRSSRPPVLQGGALVRTRPRPPLGRLGSLGGRAARRRWFRGTRFALGKRCERVEWGAEPVSTPDALVMAL